MITIPRCFAFYDEGDSTCDGDGGADPPCAMRDRCSAMKANLADKGEELSQYGRVKGEQFAPKGGFDVLAAKCDELIEEYGVKDGAVMGSALEESAEAEAEAEAVEEPTPVPTPKPKKPKKIARPYKDTHKQDRRKFLRPGLKARRAARKAIERIAKEKRKELREMLRNFVVQLSEAMPEYNWARPLEAVAPGYLYIQDRLRSSDYATVYCRTSHGRDVAVVNIQIKPRDMTATLGLPFEPSVMSASARSVLKPRPFSDGAFRYRTDHLDQEGLATAALAIAKACKIGAISLPRARLHGPLPTAENAKRSVS